MKISKVLQAYLGIVSVFALVVVGAGTYMWQTGQISSQADTANNQLPPEPVLILDSNTTDLKIGQEKTLDLKGDFSGNPATKVDIRLSFSSDKLEITGFDFTDGLLDQPITQNIDKATQTAQLVFQPLVAASGSGTIAKIKVKALAAGEANIDFVTEGSGASVVSTVNNTQTSPIVFGSVLTLE